jgi:hypothetical protein
VLRLPVRNDTTLTRIEPLERGLFRLHLGNGETLLTRKVVLATGIQGGGQWHTPSMVKDQLPASRYAHTSEMIDFAAYKGRRIAILGGARPRLIMPSMRCHLVSIRSTSSSGDSSSPPSTQFASWKAPA